MRYGLLLAIMAWGLCGCTPKVSLPSVDQFTMVSTAQSGHIDAASNEKQLLCDLYLLLKANEGEKVSLCTAEKDSKQCIKEGVSVFVQGGPIPGIGSRKRNIFKDIELGEHRLDFTKDNSSTSFIGTPMYAKDNKCQAFVRNGGLQVEMTTYYACWAGMGHSFMAEGWSIDYINLKEGIVGCQLELDIRGVLVMGGGSRYMLLKFPIIPDIPAQDRSQACFSH